LKKAVEASRSIRQVLIALGLRPAGGNYAQIASAIAEQGLSTDHFSGRRWNHGRSFGPRQPIEALLVSTTVSSYRLKHRLIKESIVQPVCSHCKQTTWMGGAIPLELDHIAGCRSNIQLTNLRLLCPNCHALTPTYRSKRRLGLVDTMRP
jgi:5-methylcytosine-specific restriction endonuclease McrA